jgi:hypothetical protein
MTQFTAPSYQVDQGQRETECAAICKKAVAQVVRDGVLAGWREQEIALSIADAAEEYVIYLATKPVKIWKAANSN